MKALRATTSRYAFRSPCSGVVVPGNASSLLTQRSSQSAATRIAIWSMHRPGATSPVVACSRRSYASMEKPPRDARYAKLEERDVQHFRSIVADPQASVVTDPDTLAPLNEDWLHKYRGYSKYAHPHSFSFNRFAFIQSQSSMHAGWDFSRALWRRSRASSSTATSASSQWSRRAAILVSWVVLYPCTMVPTPCVLNRRYLCCTRPHYISLAHRDHPLHEQDEQGPFVRSRIRRADV